jgi:hypothetical protein
MTRCLEGRYAQRVSLLICQVSRRIGLSASDREFPALTGRSGTQRARWPLRPELAALLGVWPSSQPVECAGGRRCWRLYGDVAVLCCCTPSVSPARGCGAHPPTVRFQARHIPSWRGSCGCYVLLWVADACRWLLPLLSAPGQASGQPGITRLVSAPGVVCPGCGPCPPPLSPIGLTAAGLFAGAEVSRADLRVR